MDFQEVTTWTRIINQPLIQNWVLFASNSRNLVQGNFFLLLLEEVNSEELAGKFSR